MTSTRSSREERRSSAFRRVFWWSMGYNRIVTIFYTLFLLGALPVGVLLSIISNRDYYTNLNNWDGFSAEEVAAQFGDVIRQSFNVQLTTFVIPLAVLFLVVWCARNFNFMQGRRSTDLFHSLPVRRTPLFLGHYSAGLVSMLVPLALSVGISEILCAVHHIGGVAGGPALFWLAFLLMALPLSAALTMTAFFMVVSGNTLNWLLMTTATAFGWPVVTLCANFTMQSFLPGYVSVIPVTLYTALCPYFAPYAIIPNGFSYLFAAAMEDTLSDSTELYNVPVEYLIWWAGFTALLLALNLFYYKRRKSECAENPFSFPAARGLVRSLMTIGGSLGLGLVLGTLLDSNLAYFIGLGVGALVAHTVYQGVITRGFRRFWATIPAFVVTVAMIGGGIYLLYTGGVGYVKRLPDSTQVARADFTLPDIPGNEGRESYLAANNYGVGLMDKKGDWQSQLIPFFDKQEDIETLCALHQAALDKYPGPYLPFGKDIDYSATRSLIVTYTMKNGTKMQRSYPVLTFYRDDENLLNALAAVQATETIQSYQPYYSTTPQRVSSVSVYEYTNTYEYDASTNALTTDQKKKLWETFTEEVNSPKFSNPSTLLTAAESAEKAAKEQSNEEDTSFQPVEPTYSISVGNLPRNELTASMAALLELDPVEGVRGIDGSSYTVPSCCVKTRKLIDKYTEDSGNYYYYNQDDDEDDDDGDDSGVMVTPEDFEMDPVDNSGSAVG